MAINYDNAYGWVQKYHKLNAEHEVAGGVEHGLDGALPLDR
jgi:hypothetical protein